MNILKTLLSLSHPENQGKNFEETRVVRPSAPLGLEDGTSCFLKCLVFGVQGCLSLPRLIKLSILHVPHLAITLQKLKFQMEVREIKKINK